MICTTCQREYSTEVCYCRVSCAPPTPYVVAFTTKLVVGSPIPDLAAENVALRAELATLRNVPTDADAVCIDSDCPFPDHAGECPPASPAQWEHLARLRERHIQRCHWVANDARACTKEALAKVAELTKRVAELEGLARRNLETFGLMLESPDLQASQVGWVQNAQNDTKSSLDGSS